MASYRMLQSWFIKRSTFWIFTACISVSSQAIFETDCIAFTKANLRIAVDDVSEAKVSAAIEKPILAVFEKQPFSEVVKVLAAEAELDIKVVASRAGKLVSLTSDLETLRVVLLNLAEMTDSFLVYRNGYMIYTNTCSMTFKLDRNLTETETVQLSQSVKGLESTFNLNPYSIQAVVTRDGYKAFKEFLRITKIPASITATDLVIERL